MQIIPVFKPFFKAIIQFLLLSAGKTDSYNFLHVLYFWTLCVNFNSLKEFLTRFVVIFYKQKVLITQLVCEIPAKCVIF